MLYSEKCFFCEKESIKWSGHYHIKGLEDKVAVGYCESHFKDFEALSELKNYANIPHNCDSKSGCFGFCNNKLEIFELYE